MVKCLSCNHGESSSDPQYPLPHHHQKQTNKKTNKTKQKSWYREAHACSFSTGEKETGASLELAGQLANPATLVSCRFSERGVTEEDNLCLLQAKCSTPIPENISTHHTVPCILLFFSFKKEWLKGNCDSLLLPGITTKCHC